VDKAAKIGEKETTRLLTELAGPEKAKRILSFIGAKGTFEEVLAIMTELSGGDSPESDRLKTLRRFMIDTGTGDSFILDPSITRGLDYYTGLVYETFLADLPEIGSVCSGGRYDNLAGLYSKENFSGVGSSIGIDRLIAGLESLEKTGETAAGAEAAVACLDAEDSGRSQVLAEQFRNRGIPCEVILEGDEKQLVKQFVSAEKRGAKWVIIPGRGSSDGLITLRDIGTRQNRENIHVEEAIKIILAEKGAEQ
jgi:histidyl-tRNA synthetase